MAESFKVALVSFNLVSETPSTDLVEFDTGEYKSLLAIPHGASAEEIDKRMDAQRGLARRLRRLLASDARVGYPDIRTATGVDLSAEWDGKIAGIKLIANADHANEAMIEEIRRRAPSRCHLVIGTTDVPHAAALSGPNRTLFWNPDENVLATTLRDYLFELLGHEVRAVPRATFKPRSTA